MAKKFLWVLLTTTFFHQLVLGQVNSFEKEVFEYKENIRNLQSRIKALQERYNYIGKRLDDNLVTTPKQTEPREFPSQEDQSNEVVSDAPTPEVSTPSPPPREFEVQ